MKTLYLKSTFEDPPETVKTAAINGAITLIEQSDLTAERLLAHRGLITGNQLDQNAMLKFKDTLATFLDSGGRWFFNGHMVRPLVDGIGQYQPIDVPKRPDFDLNRINPHPIWDGIDLKKIETNKGVAGFYGRGCNPLPTGAVAINGLGPARIPVDWVWARPQGGRFLSHAGNDLGTMGLEWNLTPHFIHSMIDWTNGGPCFDFTAATPQLPAVALPLKPSGSYGGMRTSNKTGRRIVAPTSGTYYHIRSLEGADYTHCFDIICAPEDLGDVLTPQDILWVPCRSPAQRMIAVKNIIARHLESGGTVVALGESHSELWLPAVSFTSTPTNWWWWLEPTACLCIEVTPEASSHPLMRNIGKEEMTWHLHGWFEPPKGATVLARDSEGHAIFYEDKITTPGTMILSSLDPMFHHGSHFMPATSRFLDLFVPNMKALTDD